jgi:hypothetical protein
MAAASVTALTASCVGLPSATWAADSTPAVEKVPQRSSEQAVTSDSRWIASFASEVRYYSWRGTRGSPTNVNENPGGGTQVYIPYALQLVGTPNDQIKVELIGRAGWVYSRQTTFGATGEVATTTDTVGSATFTYLGIDGVQPFVSLALNVPTGRSMLLGSEANARMDPDLVEIASFGEGWNVGPTVGANVPIGSSYLATVAVGYTWRGAFNRERSLIALPTDAQATTSLDPGEAVTFTGSLAYKEGPWSGALTAAVTEETITRENGVAVVRGGRRYLVNAALGYVWPETWGMSALTASVARGNRSDVRIAGLANLTTEPFEGSTLYRIGVQHLWQVGQAWVGPTVSYLHRDRNAYDPGTLQFVPAKDRYAAGVVAQYAATNKVSFNLRAEHVWTREGDKTAINGQMFSVLLNDFVLSPAVPVVSATGWQGSAGLNIQF